MSHAALKTVPQEPTTARKVNNGRGQAAGTRGCQDVAPPPSTEPTAALTSARRPQTTELNSHLRVS